MSYSEKCSTMERAIKMAKEVYGEAEPEVIIKTAKQFYDWILIEEK